MSHLKSLITPYDINNTCVQCLETLPHKAMNPIKGVHLIAASSEITTLDCLQNSISVHDMRHTQNDMKMSSLVAKRHRRLTEKHTDWKRDFNKILWQVQTQGKHETACLPRPETHLESYLFYCEQQLKKHKVQGFSMFLNGKCNGLQSKTVLIVSDSWYLYMLRKHGGRCSHKSCNRLIRSDIFKHQTPTSNR